MKTASQIKLKQNLQKLGVEPGDTLFIHSSFKSLGPVEGGAKTVIAALENTVGPDGLILMPSFNLQETVELRVGTWDIATTPSTVGWLTEYFRQMPGTFRSDHYSHSVAARGKNARTFVAGHLEAEGPSSPWDRDLWGKTYGLHSPMYKAYQSGGKLLMLGVDYFSSTYIHLVEVLYWNRRLAQDPDAKYVWINRLALGDFWDSTGELNRGKVGHADCRLFCIKTYVDTLVAEMEQNPEPYRK